MHWALREKFTTQHHIHRQMVGFSRVSRVRVSRVRVRVRIRVSVRIRVRVRWCESESKNVGW